MTKFNKQLLLVLSLISYSPSPSPYCFANNIIILLGPPGAGKTSFAEYCQKNKNYGYINLGLLLNLEQKKSTPVGKYVTKKKKDKKLISEIIRENHDLIFRFLSKKLIDIKSENIILDGYPRTETQLLNLYSLLKKTSFTDIKFILFKVNPNVSMERILNRKVCLGCDKVFNTNDYKYKFCDICKGYLDTRKGDRTEIIKVKYKQRKKESELIYSLVDDNKKITINANVDKKTIQKQYPFFLEFMNKLHK